MVNCFSALWSRDCASTEDSQASEKAALISEKGTTCSVDKCTKAPSDSTVRLAAVRVLMAQHSMDAYVIPTADAHGSEYVGEIDKRRAWISGFDGSAGTAIILQHSAVLFADSRYWVQAEKQLDRNWSLVKVGSPETVDWNAFLATLEEGMIVGMDPKLVDYRTVTGLQESLGAGKIQLRFVKGNLVDLAWGSDQPTRSAEPITKHSLRFAGVSAADKIADLRAYLVKSGRTSYLLSSLPNIAWLLNLRGNDISFVPVFYAYLLVELDSVTIFVDNGKVGKEVRKAIEDVGGVIRGYDDVWEGLSGAGKVSVNQAVSWALVEAIGEENITVVKQSSVDLAEAKKNPIEIEGFKRAYLRDGVAWVKWAAWLESVMHSRTSISEWDAAEEFTRIRSKGDFFRGLAYDNISATGENAALPHYAPTKEVSSIISRDSPYLNDSGAQYSDGTIDTTRTVHFGTPTKEQRIAFTRVLQGHIAIDTAVWPAGTTGYQLDVLARSNLWKEQLNYLHGTGHGVGSYLSVHEGPHGIGSSKAFDAVPLEPGMITSNEPAYYEVGSFGIRIESVLFVKKVENAKAGNWLQFEKLTRVPIQSSSVDMKLLSQSERDWLRNHNKECYRLLSPHLRDDKRALKYLKRQ